MHPQTHSNSISKVNKISTSTESNISLPLSRSMVRDDPQNIETDLTKLSCDGLRFSL